MRNIYKGNRSIGGIGLAMGLAVVTWAGGMQTIYAATPGEHNSAGAMLNQSRDYFEQEQLRRRLEEEKLKVRDGIVEKERAKTENTEAQELSVKVTDIVANKSTVISEARWQELIAPYKNKELTIKALYQLVEKINTYYQEGGYITCKAFLPRQKLVNGVVRLQLIEGATGKVAVEGNHSTRKGNILNRVALRPGRVDNLKELNKSLLWYNGTNDVQLRIALKAGEKLGTTDYYITAYEPKQHSFGVVVDNSGSENTGLWREGLSYSNRSLTGNRDQLYIGGTRSQGTDSAAVSYSTPLTDKGLRLGLQYSGNSVKMVKGALSEINTRGHAASYGLSLTQPMVVDKTKKVEGSLEWNKQGSKMDVGTERWLDDTISRYTGAVTLTHYGKSSVFYHKHSLMTGDWKDIEGTSKGYSKYNMSFISQKVFKNRQMLSFKGGAQWSFANYLPSADQYYIGGVYSVRGYAENLLGADSGYNVSVEYSVPDRSNSEWLWFLDYGNVLGINRYEDHSLAGTGVGYKLNLDKKVYASLMYGIPLQKANNGTQVSKGRLHFMLNGVF